MSRQPSSAQHTPERDGNHSIGLARYSNEDSPSSSPDVYSTAPLRKSSEKNENVSRRDVHSNTSSPTRLSSSSPVKKERHPLPADWAPLHRKHRGSVSYADIGKLSAAAGGPGMSVRSEGDDSPGKVSSSPDLRGSVTKNEASSSETRAVDCQGSTHSLPDRSAIDLLPDQADLLDELLEELKMRCRWLARYWTLSEKYKLYPGMSEEHGSCWRGRLTSNMEASMLRSDLHEIPQKNKVPMRHCCSAAHPGTTTVNQGECSQQFNAQFMLRLAQALASMTEVECAMRLVVELNIPDLVLISIADGGQVLNLIQSMQGLGGEGSSILSPEEIEEIQFRRDWVAHQWGSAAALGIEMHLSEEKAEYWASRLNLKPTHQELLNLDTALSELREHAIEHKTWQARAQRVRDQMATYQLLFDNEKKCGLNGAGTTS